MYARYNTEEVSGLAVEVLSDAVHLLFVLGCEREVISAFDDRVE